MSSSSMRTATSTLISFLVASCVANQGCGSGASDDDTGSGGSVGVGGSGGEVLPDPRPLTVANWNVRNFVNDVFDDPAPQEQIDASWGVHRMAVGAVLRSVDADVVVLQEVEHQVVLEELNDMELDGDYQVRVIDGNDPRGIDVGVLSKIPLEDVISHKDDTFTKEGTSSPSYRYSRDAPEIHITFNQRSLVLLGVHYRSKNNDDPDKRLAEAQHTRAIADALTAESPGTGVIILGDFNDVPASPPYEWSIGEPPDEYHNAAIEVPAAARWTFEFMGTPELVDHQMANPLMAEQLDPSSVRIIHGPEVEQASDHAPVLATYMVH